MWGLKTPAEAPGHADSGPWPDRFCSRRGVPAGPGPRRVCVWFCSASGSSSSSLFLSCKGPMSSFLAVSSAAELTLEGDPQGGFKATGRRAGLVGGLWGKGSFFHVSCSWMRLDHAPGNKGVLSGTRSPETPPQLRLGAESRAWGLGWVLKPQVRAALPGLPGGRPPGDSLHSGGGASPETNSLPGMLITNDTGRPRHVGG